MFNEKTNIVSNFSQLIYDSLMGDIDKHNNRYNSPRNLTFENFINTEKSKIDNMNEADLKQFLDEKLLSLNKLNIPEFSDGFSSDLFEFIDTN